MQCAFLSSLHRRLNCFRAPYLFITIENSVFLSFMLTKKKARVLHRFHPQFATVRLLFFTRDTGLSASKEKHASSTNVTSASTVVVQCRMSGWVCFDACFSFGRHVPERLRCVVLDFRPDSFLFTSLSYFTHRLKAMPPSGHPCQLPRFVESSFLASHLCTRVRWLCACR